jgi:hypothetical protein
MSTKNEATPALPPGGPSTITIFSHADLFYWWPVWAAGFLMALLTYLGGYTMAIVPAGTVAKKAQVDGDKETRDVLVAPADRGLPVEGASGDLVQPRLPVARSNSLGSVFITIVLLVILITNVRLSGVWSLVTVLLVLLVSVLFALFGTWDTLLQAARASDVHITAAGYLFIAVPLFVIWLAVFLFFDRRTFATFGRGQFTMHQVLGSGATTYEVMGLSLEKRRNDLFRHYLLGLGSGDLVIRTGGPSPQTFELPNVLFVDSKLTTARRLLQEREVVKA